MKPGDRFEGTNGIMENTVWEIEMVEGDEVRYRVIADDHTRFIGRRGRDRIADLQFAFDNGNLRMVSTTALDGVLKNLYAPPTASLQGLGAWIPSAVVGAPAPNIQDTPATVSSNTGMNCSKCNELYAYAEPNQPDGTLICYSCRQPH